MDVVNLHVASEFEDESQDSSGRGEAGAVSRSVAAHAANVGIGAEVQELTRDLNKTITVLLKVIIRLGVLICLDVVSIETLDLDTEKKSVSTAKKISTPKKS